MLRTLDNGADVLGWKTIPGKGDEYIILAKTESDFVTWHGAVREGRLETFWGHYFGDDEREARSDFDKRAH